MEAIKNIIQQQSSSEAKISEDFKHIDLTTEETELALFEARKKKHYELQHIAWREKICQPVEYPVLNWMQLKDMVLKKGDQRYGKFVLDEYNSEVIHHLSLYFSNDKQFEAIYGANSLKKGIMLFGDVGCGKTALMSLFQENSFRSFALVNCSKIAGDYTEQGTAVLDKYSSLIQCSRPDLTFGQKFLGCCFDDLGTEENKKHYGNQSNVMADLILARYANNFQLQGQTHFTTNLSVKEIGELYGSRVESRLGEIVNCIYFENAPDRRKK